MISFRFVFDGRSEGNQKTMTGYGAIAAPGRTQARDLLSGSIHRAQILARRHWVISTSLCVSAVD